MASYYDHKCYYRRLFPGIKQPETVAMRINGIWLDKDYRLIPPSEALDKLCGEKEAFYKTAHYSEGGAGVTFISFPEEMPSIEKEDIIRKTLKGRKGADVIVQRPIRQHSGLSELHPASVNTYRIISLLIDKNLKKV